jgi:hypothetical protein
VARCGSSSAVRVADHLAGVLDGARQVREGLISPREDRIDPLVIGRQAIEGRTQRLVLALEMRKQPRVLGLVVPVQGVPEASPLVAERLEPLALVRAHGPQRRTEAGQISPEPMVRHHDRRRDGGITVLVQKEGSCWHIESFPASKILRSTTKIRRAAAVCPPAARRSRAALSTHVDGDLGAEARAQDQIGGRRDE